MQEVKSLWSEKTRMISTRRLFELWFAPVQEKVIVTVGIHDIYSLLLVTSVVARKQTLWEYGDGIVKMGITRFKYNVLIPGSTFENNCF